MRPPTIDLGRDDLPPYTLLANAGGPALLPIGAAPLLVALLACGPRVRSDAGDSDSASGSGDAAAGSESGEVAGGGSSGGEADGGSQPQDCSAPLCNDGNAVDDDGCDNDCRPSAVVDFASGADHTCYLTRRGTVRCWGRNREGQLGHGLGVFHDIGDDEPAAAAYPVDLSGAAVRVFADEDISCVILASQELQCWGRMDAGLPGAHFPGQTGIGDDETPAEFGVTIRFHSDVIDMGVGNWHACALLADGTVICWGFNAEGVLGRPDVALEALVLAQDAEPLSFSQPATRLAVGELHVCVVLADGSVTCWGRNEDGRLGYGIEDDRVGDDESHDALGAVEVGAPVRDVVAGYRSTCVLTDLGNVRCWGQRSHFGKVVADDEWIGDDETPAEAGDVDVGGVADALWVAGDRDVFYARLVDGRTVAWGPAGMGVELGNGFGEAVGDDEVPSAAPPVDLGGRPLEIAGKNGQCAWLEDGAIRCWGYSDEGLGYGESRSKYNTPAENGDVPVFVGP